LQIEIQDYHRDQLEKDGIFLPPREETVLTLSGNFTQKDLDKAAKKGTKKQSTIAAPTIEKSLDNETLSDAIAATAKPKLTKKRSTKSDADRRFTLDEAVNFYNSTHPSDRPLKANSLKQNAKMYGFIIKERGSGMYALIDS
jgi:hypothetical protein